MILLFIIIILLILILIIFFIKNNFKIDTHEKLLKKEIKSLNNILETNKDDITNLMKKTANMSANIEKEILDENEETMSYNQTKKANINKSAIEITSKATNDGIKTDKKICKYCNTIIENDAIYCKKCGKKQ